MKNYFNRYQTKSQGPLSCSSTFFLVTSFPPTSCFWFRQCLPGASFTGRPWQFTILWRGCKTSTVFLNKILRKRSNCFSFTLQHDMEWLKWEDKHSFKHFTTKSPNYNRKFNFTYDNGKYNRLSGGCNAARTFLNSFRRNHSSWSFFSNFKYSYICWNILSKRQKQSRRRFTEKNVCSEYFIMLDTSRLKLFLFHLWNTCVKIILKYYYNGKSLYAVFNEYMD